MQVRPQPAYFSWSRPVRGRGWGSAEDIAKWESWRHLGQMNGMEAMRLYVRSVEEEQPDWYSMLLKVLSMQQEGAGDGEAPPGAAGVFPLHRGQRGLSSAAC